MTVLAGRADLREKIALLGRHDFAESHWQTFAAWLASPAWTFPRWLRPLLFASSTTLALLGVAMLAAPVLWPTLRWAILPLLVSHAAVGLILRKNAKDVIQAAGPVIAEFALIREGLALMAGQRFASPKLVSLRAFAGPGDAAIGHLRPCFAVLRERLKDWYYLPGLALLAGTQSALAIEHWRLRHRDQLPKWLAAWAEFEALNALATYAYENPEDCWPAVHSGPADFQAEDLGHPLLPSAHCVRNDVAPRQFYVISGSSMAGKSTLLRAIGLAAVLSYAGAPVRARSLRLAAMRVCASSSIVDSLREGKSRFLAEVERLRDTLATAATHPVLFLMDEIFSGTNSPDRQAAADAVIKTLASRGAIGAVTTHDISLARIARHGGRNVHMASGPDAASPLEFDYRLKEGVTRESNALAIARLAGVPV
ncbi:MAG: hypothetical protein K2X03_00150 [Bryobacteraceae bacterium]|nr:hypothetical protein [Bryobacteraceae bacterium]